MVEVIVTNEFSAWYEDLVEKDQEAVRFSVGLLEDRGVTLDHPYSSQIKGSRYAMRELRVQAQGRPIRVLYIFDRKRQAVLLLGGHKTSDAFYQNYVPEAEKLWDRYLKETC